VFCGSTAAVDPASLASALGGDRPAQGQGPVPPCSPARGRYTVRRARVSARRWSLKAPAPTRKACGGPGERRPRRYGRGEAPTTTTAARRGRGRLVAHFYYPLRSRPILRAFFTEKRIDERVNAPSRRGVTYRASLLRLRRHPAPHDGILRLTTASCVS